MIKSYQDYRAFMQNAFTAVLAVEVARFCVWCTERFAPAFGEVVFDGLEPDERTRVFEILKELKDAIGSGNLISPVRAEEIQNELENFGPQDDVARIEVKPEAIEYRSAIWNTLGYCVTRDADYAWAVSESMINAWDYRVGQSPPEYTLDNMFLNPLMRDEFELQSRYLELLRKERH
jgi:hypothetical protein